MSEIKVNKISPRTACGTTTLGDSGDTFTIPAGVTITNSGTAKVLVLQVKLSWQTTKKTDPGFTAVSGEGYFCDTSSGSIYSNFTCITKRRECVVAVADYGNTLVNTANLTLVRNGSNIGGVNQFCIKQQGAIYLLLFM